MFLTFTHFVLIAFTKIFKSSKMLFGITLSLFVVGIFHYYNYNRVLGVHVNAKNYLTYIDSSSRKDSLERLKSLLDHQDFKGKSIAGSPRVMDVLLFEDLEIVPFIGYKFIDKNYFLKERGQLFWDMYLSKSEDDLKNKCSNIGIDYIIFERNLLEKIKNQKFNETRRNFMMPHRDTIIWDSLPIIDYQINTLRVGSFDIYRCERADG